MNTSTSQTEGRLRGGLETDHEFDFAKAFHVQLDEAVETNEQKLAREAYFRYRERAAAGLAAPQIGVTKRVIVTNVRSRKGTIAIRLMINPVIVARSPETVVEVEGCLSYPGVEKAIRRYGGIVVTWEDEKRRPHRDSFFAFEARVIQHECDHLDGICRVGDDSEGEKMPLRSDTRASIPVMLLAAATMPNF